jgi:tRNA:m4X modification enzyme
LNENELKRATCRNHERANKKLLMTKIATCKYWVASRQRFCKFPIAKSSEEFCTVHDSGEGDRERIPCPADPNHMIFKKDVEKHLPKCTKVLEDLYSSRQPCTSKGCNLVGSVTDETFLEDTSAISSDEMEVWRERLSAAREQIIQHIKNKIPSFVVPDETVKFEKRWCDEVEECVSEMVDGSWETRTDIDKHNLQNACLLEVLQFNGLIPSATRSRVFVELGCGKAGLTRWLISSMGDDCADNSIFLLLDYEARRNKQEKRKDIKSKISQSSIVRLRSNITDFDLSLLLQRKNNQDIPPITGKPGSIEYRLSELEAKVASIQARPDWPFDEVVGIAKHLCGAATDFGLRCLNRVKDRRVSLSFATCCHHRCSWEQLVGNSVLVECGVCGDSQEFKRMISMAGWATTAGMPESKRLVGRLVKSTIDLCRILWIVNNFRNIESIEYRKYIEDGITPENFCIIFRS